MSPSNYPLSARVTNPEVTQAFHQGFTEGMAVDKSWHLTVSSDGTTLVDTVSNNLMYLQDIVTTYIGTGGHLKIEMEPLSGKAETVAPQAIAGDLDAEVVDAEIVDSSES